MLLKKHKMALVKARVEAVKWHNAQKQTRLLEAKDRAEQTLNQIDSIDGNIRELAFAMLYLGEGSKIKNRNISRKYRSSDFEVFCKNVG